MLSWSSNDAGLDVDLTGLADPGSASVPLDHGDALLRFATACARRGDERDDDELVAAREALAAETDAAFMVDAAAVAANFEMMTRLADGTGARMPADRLERGAAAIGAMGVADITSRR